ncbi:hypothetical protein J5N97_026274 [Dioscorea zingiberensis]|uniref:Uncharacterized protein n=1 Tax=Dioscorea zingiberensis TaxID=325984 RepID=A0A9D5C1V5_9LILI|nr:hypothetical protein J5N97_026274 [Dioscorea zingiberensis]
MRGGRNDDTAESEAGLGSFRSGSPPLNPFLIRPIFIWRSAEAARVDLSLCFIILMIFLEGAKSQVLFHIGVLRKFLGEFSQKKEGEEKMTTHWT